MIPILILFIRHARIFAFALLCLWETSLMAQTSVSDPIPIDKFIDNGVLLKKDARRDTVDARRFAELLDSKPKPLLIDLRSAHEFSRAHLKGAVNLAEPDLIEAEIEKHLPSKDSSILIYCYNSFSPYTRRVALTTTAYLTLRQLGYPKVYILSSIPGSPDSENYLRPLLEGPFAEELLPERNIQEKPE